MRRKFKRLKIVEQIAIVSLIAVIAPMAIAGFVVNNINQHAIRRELSYSAQMIAENINNNISTVIDSDEGKMQEIILAMKYIPSDYLANVYLKDVVISSNVFKDIYIYRPSEHGHDALPDKKYVFNIEDNIFKIIEKINDDKYLIAEIEINDLKNKIFDSIKNDSRQIYVVDKDRNLIFAHNYTEKDFIKTLALLPTKLDDNNPVTFGDVKNQPLAYYKIKDDGLTIIVNTTEEITEKTINAARFKIIGSMLIGVFFILFIVGLYTYYLYINVRQLFKGVMAISKGNYKRQIRLLTNVFTPHEIVFLATEFNKMVNEINISYKQLKLKNKELKLLGEFRSNLVDTVSHELRTPLTSIKGYTSRLLRQDIVIDEATKHKSLMVIKQQCDRLTRMIEDLLVIPDIEGAKLNIKLEKANINSVIESSLISVKNIENKQINNLIPPDFPDVTADRDRLEQVFINLIENASKYAYDETPISISASLEHKKAIISVENKAPYIDKQTLEKLFEKFTRVEDETTRTTRGTGLGLFIVKGLVEAMNGSIYLQSKTTNEFIVKIILPLAEEIV